MRKIAIFGATSAMALETARLFAKDGDALFLVGRDRGKLDALKQDLKVRGACSVDFAVADLTVAAQHEALLQQAEKVMGDLDHVLIAYGFLGEQADAERSFSAAQKVIEVNFTSVVGLLTPLANRFAEKHRGVIAVISSVAGDRGRQSNYLYGAAKGALSIFLDGLRNRLHPLGVSVVTIKPGFVSTPMTAHLKQGPLFAKPAAVANGIYLAMVRRRDAVYLPWFWRYIMLMIIHIPEMIFKRLRL